MLFRISRHTANSNRGIAHPFHTSPLDHPSNDASPSANVNLPRWNNTAPFSASATTRKRGSSCAGTVSWNPPPNLPSATAAAFFFVFAMSDSCHNPTRLESRFPQCVSSLWFVIHLACSADSEPGSCTSFSLASAPRSEYIPLANLNRLRLQMPTEKTWQQWLERLYNLRRDKRGSHERPHKPVLLLSILDLLDRGQIKTNEIALTPQLVKTFRRYFDVVRREDDQCVIAPTEERFYPALESLRWREQHLNAKC